VLARTPALAHLANIAALHHERLDGTGYYRGIPASLLSPPARLLAAADVYHALCQPRPHRPALAPEAAADMLRAEARAGRLDHDAVIAVLATAGHAVRAGRREWPAALSEREVEVLGLLARGLSNRAMARRLTVAEKTVGHHIQHIYNKLGVSTRAAATLFAMQHDLLDPLGAPQEE
jgi:DNA-binding CsgD family transcriptional regulator